MIFKENTTVKTTRINAQKEVQWFFFHLGVLWHAVTFYVTSELNTLCIKRCLETETDTFIITTKVSSGHVSRRYDRLDIGL